MAGSTPGRAAAARRQGDGGTVTDAEEIHVLLVEDDPEDALLERDALGEMTQVRFVVHCVDRVTDAVEHLRHGQTDAVILDLNLPDVPGLDCLHYIRKHFTDARVIVTTGAGKSRDAFAAIKEGAFEYLIKPCDREELLIRVRQAANAALLLRDNRVLKQFVSSPAAPLELVGNSPEMQSLRSQIESFSQLDATVLITGAPGTGKTAAAELIHRSGPRASQLLVSVNCRTLPRDLIGPELFGNAKEAFAGATSDRPGRLEIANGGLPRRRPSRQSQGTRCAARAAVQAGGPWRTNTSSSTRSLPQPLL